MIGSVGKHSPNHLEGFSPIRSQWVMRLISTGAAPFIYNASLFSRHFHSIVNFAGVRVNSLKKNPVLKSSFSDYAGLIYHHVYL